MRPVGRYWTADLHLGDRKVSAIRGFSSTEEHDETILGQLREVHKGSQVWILGDISSGRSDEQDRALDLLKELPADLHLIAGNHDGVSSIHRNGFKRQRKWLETFESVQQFGKVRINGQEVLMSHFPFEHDHTKPARYLEYRLRREHLPLIHGHTHQPSPHISTREVIEYNLQERRVSGMNSIHVYDRQQICVSWDATHDLVAESTLNGWIEYWREP